MKLLFITTDDPFHLPVFFQKVFSARAKDIIGIVIVDPIYKGHTIFTQALKTVRVFGLSSFLREVQYYGYYKLLNVVSNFMTLRRFYSVAKVAKFYSCPTYQTEDVNSCDFIHFTKTLAPDLIISISPPQIMKEELTSIPTMGCINLHGSVLPKYRGVLPSFWMLANNEKEAGVTVHYINQGIDDGDIILQHTFAIEPSDTLHSLIARSKEIGAHLLLQSLNHIATNSVSRTPNIKANGTYFSFPSKEAYKRFRKNGRRIR